MGVDLLFPLGLDKGEIMNREKKKRWIIDDENTRTYITSGFGTTVALFYVVSDIIVNHTYSPVNIFILVMIAFTLLSSFGETHRNAGSDTTTVDLTAFLKSRKGKR